MSLNKTPGTTSAVTKKGTGLTWLARILWVGAILSTALMVLSLVGHFSKQASAATPEVVVQPTSAPIQVDNAEVPAYHLAASVDAIPRGAALSTDLSKLDRPGPVEYVVEEGDSIFGIATSFGISPESLLWANYDVLQDDAHNIYIGTRLIVPPSNGVYYKWKQGDTIQSVADRYYVTAQDVLAYPGNHLDMTAESQEISAGTLVMVPGGWRPTTPWVVPTIPRGRAGVTVTIEGMCDTSAGGAYGSGYFIYPTGNHRLSGNDYWSGHLGLDFAAALGAPIYASDSGLVVFSGWDTTGYGNMVMIDHGNGYATLYGHMSQLGVRCGQSVSQGTTIGYAGSTGNSTGSHLHFEIRYMAGFINPWSVLH